MFASKIVWITGASSGIGRALVKELDLAGAKLVLSARNHERLEQLLSELVHPENHLVVPFDLEDTSGVREVVVRVVEHFGRIDYLINNGGISQRSLVRETSMDVFRKLMEVNYFGNVALTKAVLPVFSAQKSGHIVVISSIAGKFGFHLRSGYSASKHALHGFYESLLLEEEGNGLRVTIACPGKINTSISLNALKGDGLTHDKMDHNQADGMPAEVCAAQILKAVKANKIEVLIGNKEVQAVRIKRFAPALFWKIIRRQSPT